MNAMHKCASALTVLLDLPPTSFFPQIISEAKTMIIKEVQKEIDLKNDS